MNQIYCVKCRKFVETRDVKQKTTKKIVKCFKASVLFEERKSQNLYAQVEKGLSMIRLILCHLKCTCPDIISPDLAQS